MKVIRKEPGKEPELIEIENTLEAVEEQVGGKIGINQLTTDSGIIFAALFKEDPSPDAYALNTIMGGRFIGTVLIAGILPNKGFTDVPDFWVRQLVNKEAEV